MIMIYDMSANTFETASENSSVENTAIDYNAPELHFGELGLQLLDISSEIVSDKNMLTPELANMDCETFLRTMKK